jgi:hypothetical protein
MMKERQRDRRTDTPKLVVNFHDFAKAPKIQTVNFPEVKRTNF